MNEQEKKDLETIKELMEKEHDQAYLEQFKFSILALLDIIDNQVEEQHKQRLANAVERMKETDLQPLQAKIDEATYELHKDDKYTATPAQVQFVESRKNNLNLNKFLSRTADNRLMTNYLINTRGMKVSKELRNSLHTQGFNELVEMIDKLHDKDRQEQNHVAQHKNAKSKTQSRKMSM